MKNILIMAFLGSSMVCVAVDLNINVRSYEEEKKQTEFEYKLVEAACACDTKTFWEVLAQVDLRYLHESIELLLIGHSAECSDDNLLQALMSRGLNPNRKPDGFFSNFTALHLAETPGAVEKLVNIGTDINSQYDGGMTPLMWAVFWGRVEVVKKLIELGADVTLKDNRGYTALKYLLDSPYRGQEPRDKIKHELKQAQQRQEKQKRS